MKKIKLLFQGDSITDWRRNKEDYHDLGKGYAKYAAELLKIQHPDVEFEFIDLGIGGHETKDLESRLQQDFIDIQPDIVSILVGINDVFHYAEKGWLDNDLFEQRYRTILQALKDQTHAKIMMLEPFLIPGAGRDHVREDLWKKIEVERKLAREFADVYLPTDGLLQSAFIGDDPLTYSADGIHPTEKGAKYIANLYAEYIKPLI